MKQSSGRQTINMRSGKAIKLELSIETRRSVANSPLLFFKYFLRHKPDVLVTLILFCINNIKMSIIEQNTIHLHGQIFWINYAISDFCDKGGGGGSGVRYILTFLSEWIWRIGQILTVFSKCDMLWLNFLSKLSLFSFYKCLSYFATLTFIFKVSFFLNKF